MDQGNFGWIRLATGAAAVAVILLAGWWFAGCGSRAGVETMDVRRAQLMISRASGGNTLVVLDVRTPEEFAAGHLAGALNIDYKAADFRNRVAQLDKTKEYVVYCRSGRRSMEAAKIMAELGFPKLYNVAGGINDWTAAGFPTEK